MKTLILGAILLLVPDLLNACSSSEEECSSGATCPKPGMYPACNYRCPWDCDTCCSYTGSIVSHFFVYETCEGKRRIEKKLNTDETYKEMDVEEEDNKGIEETEDNDNDVEYIKKQEFYHWTKAFDVCDVDEPKGLSWKELSDCIKVHLKHLSKINGFHIPTKEDFDSYDIDPVDAIVTLEEWISVQP